MIKSIFHFKEENGRLKVNENFVPKDNPGIRLHNVLIGFLLWLIGKAEFIEGRSENGQAKVWLVNKGSCKNWMPNLAPEGFQFNKNDIDGLLRAVKSRVEQKKAENPQQPVKAEEKPPVQKQEAEPKKKPEEKKAENPQQPVKAEEKPPVQKQDLPQEEQKKIVPEEKKIENPQPAKNDPEKLIDDLKAMQGEYKNNGSDVQRTACKSLIFTLISDSAFEVPFIKNLAPGKQQSLANFVTSELFYDTIREGLDKGTPQENKQMLKLFDGCRHLVFEINQDADKAVTFLVKFMAKPLFAGFFLNLNEADLLTVEKSFKTFKNEDIFKNVVLFRDNNELTQDKRLKTYYLSILVRILGAYKNVAFSVLKEKINNLKATYPWIILDDISKNNSINILSEFTAYEILKELEKSRDPSLIHADFAKYYGLEGDPIQAVLPKLLFENVPNEKQADVLLLYKGTSRMVVDHLDYVLNTNKPEIIKPVFKKFLENHKKLDYGSPGAFALLIARIQKKEHLKYLLEEIKDLYAPKENLLHGISGGLKYNNFGRDEIYKPKIEDAQIKEAFEETGLIDSYSDETIYYTEVFK